MEKTFTTGDCEKISTSFELSNNKGFIPLFTRVFLDLQNGASMNDPLFTTPSYLVDASIPHTKPFAHSKGLLYYETFISYAPLSDLPVDELKDRVDALRFSYKVFDCKNNDQEYDSYDLGPYYVKSKQLVYFVTLIDLI